MEYVPIVVAVAGVHAEVLHSLGAATGRAGEREREEEIWLRVRTHYSGNSLIWMSPMDVCRVTRELILEPATPDCRGTRDSSHSSSCCMG